MNAMSPRGPLVLAGHSDHIVGAGGIQAEKDLRMQHHLQFEALSDDGNESQGNDKPQLHLKVDGLESPLPPAASSPLTEDEREQEPFELPRQVSEVRQTFAKTNSALGNALREAVSAFEHAHREIDRVLASVRRATEQRAWARAEVSERSKRKQVDDISERSKRRQADEEGDVPSPSNIQDLLLRNGTTGAVKVHEEAPPPVGSKESETAFAGRKLTQVDGGGRTARLHNTTWPPTSRTAWGVAPATIREVESRKLSKSCRLPSSPLGAVVPEEESFTFNVERLRAGGGRASRNMWDGYVPETLISNRGSGRIKSGTRPRRRDRLLAWMRGRSDAAASERPWDAISEPRNRPQRMTSMPACDVAYATEEMEPSTMELMAAVATVCEAPPAAHRMYYRSSSRERRRRSTRAEDEQHQSDKWARRIKSTC